jgi:hypothetical protein
MAWSLVKAQGQLYLFTFINDLCKGEVSVLNKAPRYEDIWGSEGIDPSALDGGEYQLHASDVLPSGKEASVPIG